MINQEKLNKIYEAVIDGKELTTKELSSYGLIPKDLSDLINDGILKRVSRGHYSLISVDLLCDYGKQLSRNRDFDRADVCFTRAYEIDSNNVEACWQMFFLCIKSENYEEAFEYVDVLLESKKREDVNFCLWLLNMITDVPEKYKDYVFCLTYHDVKISDNLKNVENIIRSHAFNRDFEFAMKELNNMIAKRGTLRPREIMFRLLLGKAIKEKVDTREKVLELLIDEDYSEVLALFKTKKYKLSRHNYFVIKLTNAILNIRETDNIPEIKVFSTDNLYDAMGGNNYQLALELMEKNSEINNGILDNNVIYMLLTRINAEIKKIEGCKNVVENEEETRIEEIISGSNSYMDIFNYLMKHDFDNSYICLNNYLNSIDKSEYEFLLVNLIKISCLENDSAFVKPMMVLTQLNQDTFQFDVSKYIGDFYIALSQNKYDVARVYLDIISSAKGITDVDMISLVLEQALDNLENKKISNVNVSEKKVQVVSTMVKQEVIEDKKNVLLKKDDSIGKNDTIGKKAFINKDYDDISFIQAKLENLYRDGIVLLRPMDSERRKGIHNIVEGISDVVSFSIGEGDERRVVLRYTPNINNFINIIQLIIDGNQAYKDGNYVECIDNFRKVLQFGRPKTFVYAKLGLAYMKAWNIKLAIDYLTVATELSKLEDNEFNFTELIDKLNGKYDPDEEKKPYVEMDIYEFIDDMHDYYEVPNMKEIFDLVSSGMSIEEACNVYNLTDEDIKIVYLIFAKKCYAEERYSLGDNYFKVVEKSSNKTDFVKWLLNEVRRNKKFYKNRVEVLQKKLS